MKDYQFIIAEDETVLGTITKRYKTVEDAKNDPSFLYDTLKGYYYDEDGHLTFEEIK